MCHPVFALRPDLAPDAAPNHPNHIDRKERLKMATYTVGIGSTNPVKISSIDRALKNIWQKKGWSEEEKPFVTHGREVPSGVAAQPMSDHETRTGAQNRAQAVLELDSSLDIAVGLEGGVMEIDDGIGNQELYSTVWVCAVDRAGKKICCNGGRMPLPPEIAEPIRNGAEMGPLMDQLTGKANVKHGEGMIGVVTQGVVDRATEYAQIATLTLALMLAD